MAVERTLSIVKPDAVGRGLTGAVVHTFEKAGLRLAALRMTQLTPAEAGRFYHVHKERPFYPSLCAYMSSGAIVPMVLEGEDAIRRVREIMGATDPAKAAEGTIRKAHALSIGENSVHGSDAPETAAAEIGFFFKPNEIHNS